MRRKLGGDGLKAKAWKYPDIYCLIQKSWMTPSAALVGGLMEVSAVGESEMVHSLLDGSRGPLTVTFLFLEMLTLCLEKRAI